MVMEVLDRINYRGYRIELIPDDSAGDDVFGYQIVNPEGDDIIWDAFGLTDPDDFSEPDGPILREAHWDYGEHDDDPSGYLYAEVEELEASVVDVERPEMVEPK